MMLHEKKARLDLGVSVVLMMLLLLLSDIGSGFVDMCDIHC